jgi:hypothetical protein
LKRTVVIDPALLGVGSASGDHAADITAHCVDDREQAPFDEADRLAAEFAILITRHIDIDTVLIRKRSSGGFERDIVLGFVGCSLRAIPFELNRDIREHNYTGLPYRHKSHIARALGRW